MTAAPDGHGYGPHEHEDVHTLHEDDPWTEEIPGHPKRTDSREYVAARRKMNEIARQAHESTDGLLFGGPPFQDHHGGSLWLKDEHGWFLVRNLAGVEWSAQFCCDPARVDMLRRNAQRLYAPYPEVVAELGIGDLLATPITSAEGVAAWTDSICNAGVPLSPELHTGELPRYAGLHHYPEPVAIVAAIKHDDFQLWVTDPHGYPAAVAPVRRRGSGDARVHVLWSHPSSPLHDEHQAHIAAGEPHVLPEDHDMARQAFAQQTEVPA